jgi:hypothetical protein
MPDDNPIGPCNIVRDETQDPGMLTRSRFIWLRVV